MKNLQEDSLVLGTNDINIDIPWDELPDTPYGTIGSIPFHDTQGQIEVNGGGQLQYILPVAIPPGIKSVAPQINLVYNSGSGNGIAGYGWSLSGISSISRMGKTLEKDGEVKGIQLDYSDFYQFNGQRLILVSGEYGKDGAEYTTEKYSNVKIKSVGTNPEQSGPAYFEVTFEDGSQGWFGLNADARIVIEYNITRWQDAQGNYISYNYIQGNNVAVIYNIEWGGNEVAGTAHFNSIIFNYTTRDLREVSYVNGKEFIQSNLLLNIEVNANNSLFKKYSFEHTKDDHQSGYQFVKSITESNSRGENANPVVFDYQKSASSIWEISWISDEKDETVLYGDFDGDGKLDLLKYIEAYEECTAGYHEEYHPRTDIYDPYDQYGYYEQVCNAQPERRDAGIYLFSSVFDDNKPEKVYTGSLGITKEQLKKAKAVNLKTLDGELLPRQGFVIYKPLFPESLGGKRDLEFKAYSIDIDAVNKPLIEEFTKVVPGSSYDRSIPKPPRQPGVNRYWVQTYIEDGVEEIDLDGDGLSELVFRLRDTYFWEEYLDGPNSLPTERDETRYRYLIVQLSETDPNKMASSLSIGPYYDENFFKTSKRGDFNGDGIVDFLHFDGGGRPYLATFKKDASGAFYIDSNPYSDIPIEGLRTDAVVGDFTGDGKTDLLVPQAVDSWNWKLYISTGKGFKVQNLNSFAVFKRDYNIGFTNIRRKFYAQDLNKDGKADFIEFYSYAHNNASGSEENSKFMIIYHENKGMDANGNIVFEEKNIDGHSGIDPRVKTNLYNSYEYPFAYTLQLNGKYDNRFASVQPYASTNKFAHFEPLIGDFRVNNTNESILVLQQGRLIKYSHYKISDQAHMIGITQGGLTTEIDYKELDPNTNPGFYSGVKNKTLKFPYVEMDKVSQSYAVSQLRQERRKQDFKYLGFTAHLQGKGMIGFRQSARSSWYAEGYEDTKVWTGTEMDPMKEGVPVKDWTIRTIDDNDLIFPDDLSVNNTALLSFKSTQYEMSKIPEGVHVIVPTKTITKDFLKDITEENSITYGAYYLPEQIRTKVNNDYAVTTKVMTYIHNAGGIGKDYFIGRPESKIETIVAYGDTKSVKEEYTYESNLVKTHKIYNQDASGWIQETFGYDMFGNITLKTMSNSVDSMVQNEASQYESRGCFVVKKIDNLGLETTIEYNKWGLVNKQTDPLGNSVDNIYDGWGKLEISKTNLGGVTTYTYEKLIDGSSKVTQYAPDTTPKETYTDKLGRHYKTRSRGFNGEAYTVSVPGSGLDVYYPAETNTYLSVSTQYDILGRKTAESEPYLDQETPKWNMISYDDSVFPPVVTATSFNGKLMKTTVEGITTLVEELNGNRRITKKTTDALENVISSEDKGGIINFSFNASNQQTSAQYGNNTVTTEYDVWGRKSRFHDPSNGTYTYEYNGFGQVTKENSPKGYKEYTYNTKGQLVNQIEKSNTAGLTDKSIDFSYNAKGQPENKTGTSNGKTYSTNLTYDTFGRLLENTENNNGKVYSQKDIIYDKLSRIVSYEKSIVSAGTTTKTIIENVYDTWSGVLSQIKDKTTGKVLWKLNAAGADGRVIRAQLGAASISNNFDEDNFLSQTNHTSSKGLIFGSSYTFDGIKNELKERTRLGNFSQREVFTYDDNNRLVRWTNPKTGNLSANKYDVKGRITENDQIGTIQFEDPTKVYQPTGAKLSTIGKQNYLNDKIRRIVYNENNDPIYIQSKKGDMRFEYGLTGARQIVMLGEDLSVENTQPSTIQYYSEDGSFEIVKDNTTGEEKHILYIGGTPYESNVVYLKDFSQNSGSYKFLHKDYLGSILAISDDEGNLVEETHFDAWGRLAAGSINLLGRGYTSHEHFDNIGIIHMNGRLYDPLLRRFLNADENIQDPYNTQNYNKYSYVLNNPMMYNDPSGEFFFAALFLIFQYIMLAMAMVQLVGMIIQLAIGDLSFGQFLKFMIIQAVSALVSYGVGELFKAGGFAIKVLGESTAKLAKPVVHALSQGVLSAMRGESFVNGFATALLASVAAGIGLKLGGNERWSRTLGATLGGAIGGGVGSVLTGGNFWQGATTGAIIGFFNDSMHDEEPRRVGNSQEVRNPKTGEKELLRDIEGLTINVKRHNPNFWMFSANFALIGGFGVSFGQVFDSYGKSAWHFSFNGNLGLGYGAGLEGGDIYTVDPKSYFRTSDFAGTGASYNVAEGPASVTVGGTMNNAELYGKHRMNPNNFGSGYRGYRTVSFGTAKGSALAFPVMYSTSRTWTSR